MRSEDFLNRFNGQLDQIASGAQQIFSDGGAVAVPHLRRALMSIVKTVNDLCVEEGGKCQRTL